MGFLKLACTYNILRTRMVNVHGECGEGGEPIAGAGEPEGSEEFDEPGG